MQGVLECPVCYEIYDENTRVPKNLSCGHTMCLQCLETLVTTEKLGCPKCRQVTTVPDASARKLVTNFNTLEALESSCSTCHDHVKTQKCSHCVKRFCETCFRQHDDEKLAEMTKLLDDAKTRMREMSDDCNNDTTLQDIKDASEDTIKEIKTFWDDLLRKVQRHKENSIKEVTDEMDQMIQKHLSARQELRIMLAKYTTDVERYHSEVTHKHQKLADERMLEIGTLMDDMTVKLNLVSRRRSYPVHKLHIPMEELDKRLKEMKYSIRRSILVTGESEQSDEGTKSGYTEEPLYENKEVIAMAFKTPGTEAEKTTSFGNTGRSHLKSKSTYINYGLSEEPVYCESRTEIKPKSSQSEQHSNISQEPVYSETEKESTKPRPKPVAAHPSLLRTISLPNYSDTVPSETYGSWGSGSGEFDWPCNVAVSTVSGNIYVSDLNNHRIHVLSPKLQLISLMNSAKNKLIQYPSGIACTSHNTILTSHQRNNTIQARSNSGVLLNQFGSVGLGKSQLNRPLALAVDSEDLIYVCDHDNCRIQVLDSSGGYIRSFGQKGPSTKSHFLSKPSFIAVSDKIVAVSDTDGNLYIFSLSGQHINTIRANQRGSFDKATGVAIDTQKNIIVADHEGKILVLTQKGKVLHTIGSPGDKPGQLEMPQGIALTQEGNILVCDSGNQRVQLFNVATVTQ